MQKALSPLRRAVQDYDMIKAGDKIAVGVSGGKDSIVLLMALKRLSFFYPEKFELAAVSIDTNVPGLDFSYVRELCEREDIPYIIKKTHIYDVVFSVRKEENPCSLCANMRRGALNGAAAEMGFNKVALGHHNDDVVETFMMNLMQCGKIGSFSPVTYLDRSGITLIRPMIYMTESEVSSCAKRNGFTVVKNPCPADGNTKRQEMKDLLRALEKDYKGVREKIFGAIRRFGIDGW